MIISACWREPMNITAIRYSAGCQKYEQRPIATAIMTQSSRLRPPLRHLGRRQLLMLTEFTHRGSAKAVAPAATAAPPTTRKVSAQWEARFGSAEPEDNPIARAARRT